MLSFQDIDLQSDSNLQSIVDWTNDSRIRHLFQRFETKAQCSRILSTKILRPMVLRAIKRGKNIQMIYWQGHCIGQISFEIDPDYIKPCKAKTAWMGIVIGNDKARGLGFGEHSMLWLEKLAKTKGAKYAKLSVFEFNTPARALYKKLGYKIVETHHSYTWWNDKNWTDYRLEKKL